MISSRGRGRPHRRPLAGDAPGREAEPRRQIVHLYNDNDTNNHNDCYDILVHIITSIFISITVINITIIIIIIIVINVL